MLSKQQKRIGLVGNFKHDKKIVVGTPQGSNAGWARRKRNRTEHEV